MSAEAIWTGRAYPEDYEPFDAIRLGDVIQWNNRLRTVRLVRRTETDHLQVIGFAKLRKSQYPGPLTYYWRSDIRSCFNGIVAHRKDLCSTDLECRLTDEIEQGEAEGYGCEVGQDETVGTLW